MVCKKCGAEVPEGSAFCVSCGAKVEEEKEPKIVKSAGTIEQPSVRAEKQSKKTGVPAAVLIIIAVIAIALLGLNYFQFSKAKTLEQEYQSVLANLDESTAKQQSLEGEVAEAKNAFSEKEAEVEKLQKENEGYKKTLKDNEETIERLNDSVTKLNLELDKAFDQNSNNHAEISFYEKHAGIVKTGDIYYHKYGCPVLGSMNNVSFQIYNTKQAQALGLIPCASCH
ncbi:MAG: zinc-ribbon domain-containing protein [Lachnospiraceae bacterium]|nr:zinc-ribbon domain-containing protein [Lachnospiraceae bacterium]